MRRLNKVYRLYLVLKNHSRPTTAWPQLLAAGGYLVLMLRLQRLKRPSGFCERGMENNGILDNESDGGLGY